MEAAPDKTGGTTGAGKALIVVSFLFVLSVAAIGIISYLLVSSLNRCHDLERDVLSLVEQDPQGVLYSMLETDPEGSLLIDSLSSLGKSNAAESEEYLQDVLNKVTGGNPLDALSANDAGIKNGRILGYLDGCAHVAGITEGMVWPRDEEGRTLLIDTPSFIAFEQESAEIYKAHSKSR